MDTKQMELRKEMSDKLKYLAKEASKGCGISKDSFEEVLGYITNDAKVITDRYDKFFEEIVSEGKQYVNFEKIGSNDVEKNRWFESTIAALLQVGEEYGSKSVKKVCDVTATITCLYPYEIGPAAEYLIEGCEAEKIPELINEGKLDYNGGKFPNLQFIDYVEVNKEVEPTSTEKNISFEISGFNDKKIKIKPYLYLVEVRDFKQEKQNNIGLRFTYINNGIQMPFSNFTVNFGEYIGMKNCAYVDTNNCWYADEILNTGIAEDTGLTKLSGFRKYPLWSFKEEFLEKVDKEVYQKYSDEYDEYMKAQMPCEEPDEEPTMGM